mgnify:CR=1 FL=1
MFGLTAGGLLNIFGDWLLVSRLGLGVYGAGLSTAISQFISFAILLVMHYKTAQGRISFRHISRKLRVYFTIMRVGFPPAVGDGPPSNIGSAAICRDQYRTFAASTAYKKLVSARQSINKTEEAITSKCLGVFQKVDHLTREMTLKQG